MFNNINSYGIFDAETIPSKIGLPKVQLSYRANQFDNRNLKIHLIPLILFDSYDRLPFSYQYLESTADRPYPIIKIIAGPGVNVVLENFPNPQDTLVCLARGIPWVNVIRVQDPRIVPPLGTNIVSKNYVGKYEVGDFSSLSFGSNLPTIPIYREDYFVVETKPNGAVVYNYFRNQKFKIKVPQYTYDIRDRSNAFARFAFQIKSLSETSGDPQLLTIIKAGDVEVELSPIYKSDNRFVTDPRILLSNAEYYALDNLDLIPPQGYSIKIKRDWEPSPIKYDEWYLFSEKDVAVAQLVFDLGIGFFPIVGDVVDIAEFLYAIEYGKDKWGNEVSTQDLVIMGIGSLLPFISSAVFKGSAMIARKFKNYAVQAEESLEILRKADLPEDALKTIAHAENLIKQGKKVPKEVADQLAEYISRLDAPSKLLDDILNVDGSGFTNTKLNEAYQKYKQRRGDKVANPKEWALRQTTGFPREIFEKELGKNYARQTRVIGNSKRFKNIDDTPKPKDYSQLKIKKHIQTCWRNKEQLFERLLDIRDEILKLSPELQARALKQVNEGLLRIFKGNIGEILSKDKQIRILQEVATEFPDVMLISGLKVKLPGNNNPKLFSDNILATMRSGNLQVRGVFEVKAGYKGGSEATTQIFEWIEGKLDEGAQLIIPQNAHIIDRKRREIITQTPQFFTYSPGSSAPRRVERLASANRYIITAKGKSHLGLESSSQIAAEVNRVEMDVTSEQIDYLMKILFPSILKR